MVSFWSLLVSIFLYKLLLFFPTLFDISATRKARILLLPVWVKGDIILLMLKNGDHIFCRFYLGSLYYNVWKGCGGLCALLPVRDAILKFWVTLFKLGIIGIFQKKLSSFGRFSLFGQFSCSFCHFRSKGQIEIQFLLWGQSVRATYGVKFGQHPLMFGEVDNVFLHFSPIVKIFVL